MPSTCNPLQDWYNSCMPHTTVTTTESRLPNYYPLLQHNVYTALLTLKGRLTQEGVGPVSPPVVIYSGWLSWLTML